MTKQIKVKDVQPTPAEKQKAEKTTQLRNEIAARITQRNLPAAAKVYLELMNIDSGQILPRQYLLDIANQLASENNPAQAAWAYEQFLTHYSIFPKKHISTSPRFLIVPTVNSIPLFVGNSMSFSTSLCIKAFHFPNI